MGEDYYKNEFHKLKNTHVWLLGMNKDLKLKIVALEKSIIERDKLIKLLIQP